MRLSLWLSANLILLAFTLPSSAQPTIPLPLLMGEHLKTEGKLQAAIAVLEPLVQPSAHVLNESEAGIAWNLLGSTYQDLEQYDKAIHCYEVAIKMLRNQPSQRAQYAAAIDNLGSVDLSLGQVTEAKTMRLRAQQIYQSLGNHEGISRTSGNLAVTLLEQRDLHGAQRYLSDAFREAQLSRELSNDAWAAMYSVQGELASAHQDFHSAILAYQKAIDRWTRGYGPECTKLGVGYALLGQAEMLAGSTQQAMADIERALAIQEKGATSKGSIRYLQTEILRARLLRVMGSEREGARLEEEATTALAHLPQRCNGCTISVESFR